MGDVRHPGEPDGEVAAVVKLGSQLTPASIAHAGRPDLAWIVWQTLESWRISTAGFFGARGTPAVLERHRVLVAGPVPERLREYADRTSSNGVGPGASVTSSRSRHTRRRHRGAA